MAVTRQPFTFNDEVATATRVTVVDSSGTATGATPTSVQRTPGIQRVTTATTTTITAGKGSISATVIAASSAASPTIGGVAVPAGGTVTWNAANSDTLASLAIVTLSGDDVLITTL